MTAAASRSSAALRAELAQIDTDLSAQDGRLSSCDTQVRVLALLARRGDPAKVKGIAEARSLKVSIACEIDFTSAASGAQCGAGCRARARGDGGAAGEAAERLIPKQTDVGAALPGDDPSSVVHADRNAANAAIAAAAAGPAGRKSPMRKQEFAVAVNLESDPRMASYNVYIRHALHHQGSVERSARRFPQGGTGRKTRGLIPC